MQDIFQLLKKNHIKVTPQRIAVYNILFRQQGHLTADELHERVKKEFPSMSLATVYTILEVFKGKGLVQENRINFQRSSYDAREEKHHHFQCRACGRIFDVDIPLCKTLEKKEADGHSIDEFQGYFYGTCSACRQKQDSAGLKKNLQDNKHGSF